MTNWRQLGLQLGPRQRNLGPSWASLGAVGPTRANFADSMRHAEHFRFYCYFHRLGVHARPCCPHWPVLDPISAPAQDQVAHVKPNLHPNVPKLRGSVGLKFGPQLEPTGPSSAQVRPKLGPSSRPRMVKFDPSWLWLGQVGPLLS
jgi:hypothetical protein